MTPERLPQELVDRLNAPLPPEAIKAHPTKKFLSTIKTIYQIERLNEVFGINGWIAKSEIVEQGTPMVIMKVTLKVPAYGIELEQYGGNDNPDRGDAYKGAFTDALSKICGYMGIGMAVYKGDGPTVSNPQGNKPSYDAMRHAADARQAARQAAAEDAIKAAGSVVEVTGPGLQKDTRQIVRIVPTPEPGLQHPHDEELRASIAAIPDNKFVPKMKRGRLTGKQITLVEEFFGPMKKRYDRIESEARYYEILTHWGVEKSSHIDADNEREYAKAMRCIKEMEIDVAELEVAAIMAKNQAQVNQ